MGRRSSSAALLALVLAASLWSAADAAQRVALVIGNAAYAHTSPLRNPLNDARAMAARLNTLGFSVQQVSDADRLAMARAIKRFGEAARGADTAVVFYSGHGMEAEGRNFLIPIDAALEREGDAELEGVPLSTIVAAAAEARRLSVAIIDACRNNRFPSSTRSGAKGFVAVGARPGQVIAFSTAPGKVAYDGEGDLSPFTRALTEALDDAPEEDVRILFTSLGAATARYAGADQRPFARIGDMKRGRVSLTGAPPRPEGEASAAPAAPLTPPSTREPSREEAVMAQSILKRLGYYDGAIDGGWGSESRAALSAYARDNGLGSGGALSRPALAALRRSAEQAAQAAANRLDLGAAYAGEWAAYRLSLSPLDAGRRLMRGRVDGTGLGPIGFTARFDEDGRPSVVDSDRKILFRGAFPTFEFGAHGPGYLGKFTVKRVP